MASHDFKTIIEGSGAVIVASSLTTGRSVFFNRDGSWSTARENATVYYSDSEANEYLDAAKEYVTSNDILDPYLVVTDAQGEATHIREHIRQHGPTVDAIPANWLSANP